MIIHSPADLTTPWATGYGEGYAEGFGQGFIDGLVEILQGSAISDLSRVMAEVACEFRGRCSLASLRRMVAKGCLSREEALHEIDCLIFQERIPPELGGNREASEQ